MPPAKKPRTNADLVATFLKKPVAVPVEGIGTFHLQRLGDDDIEQLRMDVCPIELPEDATVADKMKETDSLFRATAKALAKSAGIDEGQAFTMIMQSGLDKSPLHLAMLDFAGLETAPEGIDEGDGDDDDGGEETKDGVEPAPFS